MYVLLSALILIVGIVAAAGMIIAVLSFSNGDEGPPVNINMGGDSSGSSSGGSGGGYQGEIYRLFTRVLKPDSLDPDPRSVFNVVFT